MLSFKNISRAFLIVVTLFTLLFFGIFMFTRGAYPHSSELSFIEHSNNSGLVGSVIPASCESNPPSNHDGSCPPGMWVNLGTGGNGMNFSYGVSSPEGMPVVDNGGGNWTIGDGRMVETQIMANLEYNATGAGECRRSDHGYSGAMSTVGAIVVPIRDRMQMSQYTIACTDGVHWVTYTFNIFGNYVENAGGSIGGD